MKKPRQAKKAPQQPNLDASAAFLRKVAAFVERHPVAIFESFALLAEASELGLDFETISAQLGLSF